MALEDETLENIHTVILSNTTLSQAAKALGVNARTLERHLSLHINEPLSYKGLKRLTVDQARERFGDAYQKKLVAPKISLNERTLRTVHECILNSKNVNNAASKLGVVADTLNSHLGKFLYEEGALSYEILRNLSVAKAIEQFGDDYEKEMKAPKVSLDKMTLYEIHSAILKHKTLHEAANSLGSFYSTLASHLAKFSYLGGRLNFELLKELNVEQAREQFGDDYEKEINAPKVSLSEMTLRGIHLAIRNSTSLNAAATSLGVSQPTLKTHLNKFVYQTDALSYELLKQLTVDAAKEEFGEDYEKEMKAPKISLSKMTFRSIHSAIRNSKSVKDASASLGVSDRALTTHLKKFSYNGSTLNYDFLRALAVDNATQLFGEDYEKQMVAQQIPLKERSLRDIHSVILQSSSLNDASQKLRVYYQTLKNYLTKFLYREEPLSYEILEKLTIDEAKQQFGEGYEVALKTLSMDDAKAQFDENDEQEMPPLKNFLNEIPLRTIHDAILSSTSLYNASTILKVHAQSLARYIGNFLHKGVPLSYKTLKKLTIAQAQAEFGEAYEKKIPVSNVPLNKRTMQVIHTTILESKNLSDAACMLHVDHKVLAEHLNKFLYENTSLSYDLLRALSVPEALEKFGEDYEKEMNASPVPSNSISLHSIHQVILSSNNLHQAAHALKIHHQSLARYIGKFFHEKEPLNYEQLKALTEEQAKVQFGENYERGIDTPKASLDEMTFRVIHCAIKESNSLSHAAGKLGVHHKTLEKHLNKFFYAEAPLSYRILNNLAVDKAKELFGDNYEERMNDQNAFNLQFQRRDNLLMDAEEDDPPALLALYATTAPLETLVQGNLADQNMDENYTNDGTPKRPRMAFFPQSPDAREEEREDKLEKSELF